ncbi:MAG: hypothetical protein MT490_13275 [Sphingomonas sp.]|uniref:hypothetical protein n=1 Tax=Sphingomonas sp. TaxID=28214 RepID=UPI002272849D|nr:hypothetical protein [Sphingomonas sp.]MCX8476764.1 hypothetical protein [Sphingomonas sp.]
MTDDLRSLFCLRDPVAEAVKSRPQVIIALRQYHRYGALAAAGARNPLDAEDMETQARLKSKAAGGRADIIFDDFAGLLERLRIEAPPLARHG